MISDDLRLDYEAAVRRDIPRSVLIEVSQSFPLAAAQARAAVANSHRSIEGGTALSRSREAKAAGLVRFQVLDEMFEQIVIRNGGEFIFRVPIDQGANGSKEAPIFLTTGKFGGTLLGFASHREKDDLPIRNASRLALSSQNRGLTPDMFAPMENFAQRSWFALILAQRAPDDIGKISSMTITLVDPKLEAFLFRKDINEFMAAYGERPQEEGQGGRKIRLKPAAHRFKSNKGPADRSSGTE